MILNLSVNARDAMPGGGRLVIEAANVVLDADRAREYGITPGDYVEIAVADTGLGMAPDVARRAFDPFFTTKDVGKGTGLGLSQVFGFARQSGGHVRIETAEGKGTIVRVLLPRYSGTAAPAPVAEVPSTVHRGTRSEVILVVEDEDRVRSYSTEALRELGYTVTDARDGPEALRIIEHGQPITLLFTDVVMPEMTGLELAARARAHLPGLKVLYTSGYTRDAILGAGADEHAMLPKPFGVDQLARHIRAALDS
jgi:CheY-like chemotaxis protein